MASEQILLNRYRVVGGQPIIELKLKSPHQLFDERDPAPFRERDLDDDAARYIVDSYKELPTEQGAKLSLYFSQLGDFAANVDEIRKAIHHHFRYESELKRRELRETIKTGFASLAIGASFLLACTWFSLTMRTDGSLIRSLLHEWLLLMGWVATWKPVSIFLYEWWPVRGAMRTFAELGALEIEIHTAEAPPIVEEKSISPALPPPLATSLKIS